VALPAPSDREKTQMFMQRYIERFPAAGEIVIFDRSWYNRAGVEYVMGFCTEEENRLFLGLCPEIEKYIVDGGIKLIKIWLEVGQEEQERRFSARIDDPLRQWKLSPMDLESYRRWYDYSRARPDAANYGQRARPLVHCAFRRQTAGTAELHLPHPRSDSVREGGAHKGQAAQAIEPARIR
jgi:polyphosphate kinase 2 (PPK2 family)